MNDGRELFAVIRLPRETAQHMNQLQEATATWAGMVAMGLGESTAEREAYREMCLSRKWLAEHIELLCNAAGVEHADDDLLVRCL